MRQYVFRNNSVDFSDIRELIIGLYVKILKELPKKHIDKFDKEAHVKMLVTIISDVGIRFKQRNIYFKNIRGLR